jgi:hypothetical protein
MERRNGVKVNRYNTFPFLGRSNPVLRYCCIFIMFALTLWFLAGLEFSAAGLLSRTSVPVATTKNGSFAGLYSSEYNQDFFLGVPYAQPPVGGLRFKIPQSLNSTWTGTKNAQEYSPECVGYGVRFYTIIYFFLSNRLLMGNAKYPPRATNGPTKCLRTAFTSMLFDPLVTKMSNYRLPFGFMEVVMFKAVELTNAITCLSWFRTLLPLGNRLLV